MRLTVANVPQPPRVGSAEGGVRTGRALIGLSGGPGLMRELQGNLGGLLRGGGG